MKKLVFIFFLGVIISCTGKTKEIIEEKYPDGSPKIIRYYNEKRDTLTLVKEIEYFPNHNKKQEGSFRNGQRDGKWQVWYDNGNLWSEGYFDEGVRDGACATWYENGKKRYEGQYKNSKESGKWTFWDENGALVKKVDFDNLTK